MEKSVDWFAENTWPVRNNYLDIKNDHVTFGSSEDEDIPDWFAENAWPASKKGGKEDKVRVVEKDDEEKSEINNYSDKKNDSHEGEDIPGWLTDNAWKASNKKEKLSPEKTDPTECWLRENGWPVRHEMRNDVANQP